MDVAGGQFERSRDHRERAVQQEAILVVEVGNAGVERPSVHRALHLRAVICSPAHATVLEQRNVFPRSADRLLVAG